MNEQRAIFCNKLQKESCGIFLGIHFCRGIKVLEPDYVREEYMRYLKQAMDEMGDC